ncbi:MAG: hypothetical protein ACRDYE_10600, partial [Acidimicrobiales bacterium]
MLATAYDRPDRSLDGDGRARRAGGMDDARHGAAAVAANTHETDFSIEPTLPAGWPAPHCE